MGKTNIEIAPRVGIAAGKKIDTGIIEAFVVDEARTRVAFTMREPATAAINWTAENLSEAVKRDVADAFKSHRKTKPNSAVVEHEPQPLVDGPKDK